MTDDEAVVPACDGVFTAKITRLSDGREGGAPPPPSPPPHQHQQQQQQQQYIQGMAPSASASIRRPVNSGGLGGYMEGVFGQGRGGTREEGRWLGGSKFILTFSTLVVCPFHILLSLSIERIANVCSKIFSASTRRYE